MNNYTHRLNLQNPPLFLETASIVLLSLAEAPSYHFSYVEEIERGEMSYNSNMRRKAGNRSMEKQEQRPQGQPRSAHHAPGKASVQKPTSLAPTRPATNDPATWKGYWEELNQFWRTEPEISQERQQEIKKRRAIVPDMQQGNYPFKGIPLTRADIEWLLATHNKGHDPFNQSSTIGTKKEGLELRGADLHGADLRDLPLSHIRGGLSFEEMQEVTEEQQRLAAILLQKADLSRARLKGAYLSDAQLEGAYLSGAQLQEANLSGAQLERADLSGVQLENTLLYDVLLCDESGIGPRLADVQWGNTNLVVIDWTKMQVLGDEQDARQKTTSDGERKDKDKRLAEFRSAVRANRQLAVALQGQGLNEEASRFAYCAQKLQRVVLRLQRKWGQYLFNAFLEALAGYGYRPIRTVLWYLGMILLFALAYHSIGGLSLYPPDAFVYSLTSFHGRGFFPGLNARPSLHDPLVMLAAIEAVIGLFIEISFIATFTQRFFGK
jgi:uncharacterized protein YjbI with pentapeptide repeats